MSIAYSPISVDYRWINPFEWGNAIRDAIVSAIQNFLSFFNQYIITPLYNAIKEFTTWLWNNLVNLFNSLFSSILNFIYGWIVNPIISLFQTALNRLREKMKGIIYITITLPLLIKQAKTLHETESFSDILRKSIFFIFKPIIGFFTTEVLYAVISSYLQPVTIPPVTPPTPPSIPPITERSISITDYVSPLDTTSITLMTYPAISDYTSINDIISLELITGERIIETADEVDILDTIIVELL